MSNIGTENKRDSRRNPIKRPRKKPTALEVWNGFVRGFETVVNAIIRVVVLVWSWCISGLHIVRGLQPTVRTLCIALVLVMVLGVVLSAGPVAQLMSTKQVMLSDDALNVQLKTRSGTVGQLLREYDITLGEGDVVYPTLSDPLKRGEEVIIRRAFSVSISVDGQKHSVSLLNGTVGKALYLAGVNISPQDIVQPELTQAVSSGMDITINRVQISTETENKRIPYHITYQDDSSMYIGKEEMIKQGSEGTKEVTLRVVTVDGVETERTTVSEVVTKSAENRIVAQGTKPTPTPTPKATPKPTATPKKSSGSSSTKSPSKTSTATQKPKNTPDPDEKTTSDVTSDSITVDGKTYSYSKTLSVMITAYTHTGRKTSTGVWPSIGTVAVDKGVIPYGTKLYIPGYGFGVAQDTGVSGNHIDVFFDTEAECIKYGRKRDRTIYILD